MPTPDSAPFTDAPFALQALWHKFALRGELDPLSPPATVREAYTQVVGVHLKEMRETVEAIEADIRNSETEMLASAGPPDQATPVWRARSCNHTVAGEGRAVSRPLRLAWLGAVDQATGRRPFREAEKRNV